ncbi:MAG: undecaprenyl-diphosphate phosphatase [Armatimonadetes bacterium]|nr:undecaprenyl-diphosphate phosphatase [Armatimonadota bacterium]
MPLALAAGSWYGRGMCRRASAGISIARATLLGVAQGLTEFLPVSSSAHLLLLGRWVRFRRHSLDFDVVVHLGCLGALAAHCGRDWAALARGGWLWARGVAAPGAGALAILMIACIPAAAAGVLLERPARGRFRRPAQVSILTAAMGLALIAADCVKGDGARLGWRHGVAVGLAQALALLPGVSRSGITITAGVLWGLSLPAAVEFSFLVAGPILAGAALWGLRDLPRRGIPREDRLPFAAGIVASGVTAYLAIAWMLRYVVAGHLAPFGLYRLAFAALLWRATRDPDRGRESPPPARM